MLVKNRWWATVRRIFSFLMAAVLTWGLVGCTNSLPFGKRDRSQEIETPQALDTQAANLKTAGQLSEVAPPSVIQQLSEFLDVYQPQVTIVSPKADEVIQDTTVSVQFQVQDLPIFKDPDLGMGPHLHVIVDNQPYRAVYDVNQPFVLEDLSPGTHTLRVFASRPWHESFKNEGAYAQTTFHVLTKNTENNPDPALPLLTYSRPTGSYGAEPIMLDFYLTNAPLHLVARENPDDEIADWRIRVTLNGESFVLDRWQPVYLKGFKPGKNWVKLEFLDEQGNPLNNVFNETVRLINYEPEGKDTLSKLVRGELSVAAARGIVDPNYKVVPEPTLPSPDEIPAPSPSPSPSPFVTPLPIAPVAPAVEATPTPEQETPSEVPTPAVKSLPTPEPEASQAPSEAPAAVEAPQSKEKATLPAPPTQKKSWFGGFFNRFNRPSATPSPAPERLEQEIPSPAPAIAPQEPEQKPEPEALPTPSEAPAIVEEPQPTETVTPTTPSGAPFVSPEVLETPATEPTDVPEAPEPPAATPQPEESIIPSPSPAAVEVPTPTEKPTSRPPATIIKSWFEGLFNRFARPTNAPSPVLKQLEQETPLVAPAIAPQETERTPAPEASSAPNEAPAAVEEPTPTEKSSPSEPPALPEVVETPTTEPTVVPETLEPSAASTPQPEESVIPSPSSMAVEEPTPPAESVTPEVTPPSVIEPVPVRPIQPEESKADSLPQTLPEIVDTPLPELSEPKSTSPQTAPESSPATQQEAASTSELPSDQASITSESEVLQKPNPEAEDKESLPQAVQVPADTPSQLMPTSESPTPDTDDIDLLWE